MGIWLYDALSFALSVFLCQYGGMASIISGRIKKKPSGLVSVIFSHVPSGCRGFKPCRVYRSMPLLHLALSLYLCGCASQCDKSGYLADSLTWQSFQSSARTDGGVVRSPVETGLIAGRGGLGHKDKMSWRSSEALRERLAACELEFGVGRLGILTITQPSVDERAYEGLARYSGYAIDRLNREFKRYFGGQRFARCSVWEYQDRGSLHAHIVLAAECMDAVDCEDFRLRICEVWYRILGSVSDKFDSAPFLSECGHVWSLDELKSLKNEAGGGVFVNFQKVEKSVVAYLSEYLSSSNHEDDDGSKNAKREKFFPISTWCQWDREATYCFNKYNEDFPLGECEPDRRKELELIKEKLHFEVLKKIPLARDTEIKQPQNPYNFGVYFIPAFSESGNVAKLLVGLLSRLSHIFKEKCRHQREAPVEFDYSNDWTSYDLFQTLKGRFKRLARRLFFCGKTASQIKEKLLDYSLSQFNLIDKINSRRKAFNSVQLEIKYAYSLCPRPQGFY